MSIDPSGTVKPAPGIACVACGGRRLIRWGPLPVNTPDFLGRDLDSDIDPGILYECADCTLRFRSPQPGQEELMAYYRGLDVVECWQHGPRDVWREIRDALGSIPQRSVLDVGCFRGDMLNYLGDGFERFGVEPSKDAARAAERRGITIIADSIESLPDGEPRFGAITLIDVAEHLPRPLDSLKRLSQLLLPGGKLIIFTGNTDALSWRLAGLDYYYSAMPEHVAFMGPSWFRWVAPRIGCEVVSIRPMRYRSSSWREWTDEGFKNLLYTGYQRLRRVRTVPAILFRLPLVRRIGQWRGSWWTSAKDHALVILIRQTTS